MTISLIVVKPLNRREADSLAICAAKRRAGIPNSFVIWRGPSELNGEEVIMYATGVTKPSENDGTGPMVQVWFMPADKSPIQSVKDLSSESVCGNCPHKQRTCYVNVGNMTPMWRSATGPDAVEPGYNTAVAWLVGSYVRFGAWGDPASVPESVIEGIVKVAKGHTLYSHQMRDGASGLSKFGMDSCDTPEQYREAVEADRMTFRVRAPGEPLLEGEFDCPKSVRDTNCVSCMACDGGPRGERHSPSIVVHGLSWKVDSFIANAAKGVAK